MPIKTYSELITIPSYIDRFKYLQCYGQVGVDTFGYDRYLNQMLYHDRDWLRFRDKIYIRDNGCDLAVEGFDIVGSFLIHHINPITVEDVKNRDPKIFDPENAITTTQRTHRAIHYGDEKQLTISPTVRTKYDTCPWKK